jgi:branched-chain amino acid transport system substrate-binding protein
MQTKTIIAAMALAFAGAANAQEVVKIGYVGPLSGQSAHLGKDNQSGVRMAVEDLNAKGFKVNGKAVKFEMVSEDDAGDPKQGTSAAQKLVDAQVNGVIGHQNSGTTIPASKIYFDAGIPQISASSTSPVYTNQGFNTAFRVVANDFKLGSSLGKYATQKLNAKRIAVIDDRTAYGQGVASEFLKEAKKGAGVQIVDRLQRHPDRHPRQEPGPGVLRRHGLGGRPAAAPDEGAGHQGQADGRRRHLHRSLAQAVGRRR